MKINLMNARQDLNDGGVHVIINRDAVEDMIEEMKKADLIVEIP